MDTFCDVLTLADRLALQRFADIESATVAGTVAEAVVIGCDFREPADFEVLSRLTSYGLLETYCGNRLRITRAGLQLARPAAPAWPRRTSIRRR